MDSNADRLLHDSQSALRLGEVPWWFGIESLTFISKGEGLSLVRALNEVKEEKPGASHFLI